MALRIPLGISDFRTLREGGLTYVDKSSFIREVLDDTAAVILLPRPRRFGKTLNLSMLRYFLEKSAEPRWPLFEGLDIAAAGEPYRRHFQRYPVVLLTFKDVKALTWEGCRAAMASVIGAVYQEHGYLLKHGLLEPTEAGDFSAILEKRASDVLLWSSLARLSAYLHRHHKEPVVLLLDEYDTPIHAGYTSGYYDQVIEFFRNFLSGGLKDNSHLFKGVLTGILRVARDSVFTGLNNLEVYSILRPMYHTYFGFTEPEVAGLLAQAGQEELLPEVQRWYNGYLFGDEIIYNPWSVLSFIKRGDGQCRPYWVETSSNDLVRQLLIDRGLGFSGELEQLIGGEVIEQEVTENVALREVEDRPDLLWSFLLFTGYLKVVRQRQDVEGSLRCELAIPNQEVRTVYRSLFSAWINRGLGGEQKRETLVRALLAGDAETCERLLRHWMLSSASFYDTASLDPPERFYHGFILGLLISLGERYEVLSNRESGYGRCDVMVTPRTPGLPGVVLELKARDQERGESIEVAMERALTQLAQRDYAAALRARGADPVRSYGVVFDGKRVWVKLAEG